jgi:vacuolar-type H+-ATPase subunit H
MINILNYNQLNYYIEFQSLKWFCYFQMKKEDSKMEEENAGITEELYEEINVTDRVAQFIDEEGERIRQETERVQSPIIAKARQEYKKRLSAFLEEEREKIRGEAEREAVAIRSRAESEANDIIATVRAEAQVQAEQIIEEVKRQVDVEREEELTGRRREANAIIEDAKQTAERLTNEANELARKTIEEESTKILAEARLNASKEAAAIISNSWRRAQQMFDSAEKAYSVVRKQLQDCLKVVTEADHRMSLIPTTYTEERLEENEPELTGFYDENELEPTDLHEESDPEPADLQPMV